MNNKEINDVLNAIDKISESIKLNIITGQYKDARADAELLHMYIKCHTPSEQFAASTDKSEAQEPVKETIDTVEEVNAEMNTASISPQNMGQSTTNEDKESLDEGEVATNE